jgi:hypothetical protein
MAAMTGDFDGADKAIDQADLDRHSPVTAEDCLFKGLVETIVRPERGLQMLDQAVRRRDSVIARTELRDGPALARVACHLPAWKRTRHGRCGVPFYLTGKSRISLGLIVQESPT